MTLEEQLRAARDLILDEDHWVARTFLKDQRRCALGALAAVLKSPPGLRDEEWCGLAELLRLAAEQWLSEHPCTCLQRRMHPIPHVNDLHGFEAIHEVFDLAIKRAAEENHADD